MIDVPPAAFGNVTVVLEGRPVADLLGNGVYSRIPVRDAVADVEAVVLAVAVADDDADAVRVLLAESDADVVAVLLGVADAVLDTVLVPVSGGGMIGGIALAIKALRPQVVLSKVASLYVLCTESHLCTKVVSSISL